MNFITKNLKQAGVFNTILIATAIIVQVYLLCIDIDMPTLPFAICVIVIIALAFGLFYAFYGYKKEAAKYYKAFMVLSLISYVVSAISHLPYFANAKVRTFAAFARIIPLIFLSFKKDFGKKNSVICASVVFICSLINLIGTIMKLNFAPVYILSSLNQVLLSAITIIFVEAKYADKEARGTK